MFNLYELQPCNQKSGPACRHKNTVARSAQPKLTSTQADGVIIINDDLPSLESDAEAGHLSTRSLLETDVIRHSDRSART